MTGTNSISGVSSTLLVLWIMRALYWIKHTKNGIGYQYKILQVISFIPFAVENLISEINQKNNVSFGAKWSIKIFLKDFDVACQTQKCFKCKTTVIWW